eukprot:4038580-Pleurochrysis_carterae.AAC.1
MRAPDGPRLSPPGPHRPGGSGGGGGERRHARGVGISADETLALCSVPTTTARRHSAVPAA